MSDTVEDSVTEERKMTEVEEDLQHRPSLGIKNPDKMNFSFNIWPPSQRTRDAVINRLIETLTAPSVLSKRYGSMPADEASSAARLIEEEAFSLAAAAAASSENTTDDGIEILQLYSKEISKRMLETVKSRVSSASSTDIASQASVTAPAPATSEEISSLETESS